MYQQENRLLMNLSIHGFQKNIPYHQLRNLNFVYIRSEYLLKTTVERKQRNHSRGKKERKIWKLEEIVQKYLLQHFKIKLNHKNMVSIDQCQWKIFLLIMYFCNIFQKIVLIRIKKFRFFIKLCLMIAHFMALSQQITQKPSAMDM